MPGYRLTNCCDNRARRRPQLALPKDVSNQGNTFPMSEARQNSAAETTAKVPRVTTKSLQRSRERGEKLTMLTAYDFPTAKLLDEAGIDLLLVGDSLAMVVGGHETTLPVTMDQILYHAEMVGRAAKRAMVVVDLPFPEGQLSINRTLESAARVLKETQCHAVKLEGGRERAATVAKIVQGGVAVMGHIGLTPQAISVLGGFRAQGRYVV